MPWACISAFASAGTNRNANLARAMGTVTLTLVSLLPSPLLASIRMRMNLGLWPCRRGGAGARCGEWCKGCGIAAGGRGMVSSLLGPKALRRLAACSTLMVPSASRSRIRRLASLLATVIILGVADPFLRAADVDIDVNGGGSQGESRITAAQTA